MGSIESLLKAAKTTRPTRSTLLFLLISLGFVFLGYGWGDALFRASPILLVSMAGFCINDIFDQEVDRINHPERPLAMFPALARSVTSLYVVLFVASVIVILLQEDLADRFLWAISFILISNYNFFRRAAPLFKNAYVSITACFPLAVLDLAHDGNIAAPTRYLPLVLVIFARELSCDIPDTVGDTDTLAKRMSKRTATATAGCLYFAAAATSYFSANEKLQVITAISIVGVLAGYFVAKLVFRRQEKSLFLLSGAMAVLAAIPVIM